MDAMDDRDSFYCRAIRTKLGDAPRAQYDLLPDTPTKALFELYQLERAAGNACPDLGRLAERRTPDRWVARRPADIGGASLGRRP
jgi:hypothetical protein